MTKIYFAGSIRGGREDAEWYYELIKILRKYGRVLSEHIGDPNVLAKESKLIERQIYQRDIEWLKEADVIIAEVTTPSLGVGYELCFAEALKIPALCLFQKDAKWLLTAMIRGSGYFENTIVEYKKGDIKETEKIIDNFFKTRLIKSAT